MKHIPWGWFDLIVIAILVVGIVRGRLNGMSKEFVPLVQWLAIVVGGALGYPHLARTISRATMLEPFYANILSYLIIAVAVFLIVITVKSTLERWLLKRDIFGRLEYFLGMLSGMVRFGCIIVFILALVNAREYTKAEIERDRAAMKEIYGNEFFPKLYTIQETVFVKSYLGRMVKQKASWLLLEPQRPGVAAPRLREWQPE